MNRLRYEELRAAGPVITAEDETRLKTFRPRLTLMAMAVRLAYWNGGWRRKA